MIEILILMDFICTILNVIIIRWCYKNEAFTPKNSLICLILSFIPVINILTLLVFGAWFILAIIIAITEWSREQLKQDDKIGNFINKILFIKEKNNENNK